MRPARTNFQFPARSEISVDNGFDQLSTLYVVTFAQIFPGNLSKLTKDKVIGTKDLTVETRSDAVHGPRLQIHEHGAWNIPSATGFVEVDVDALKLKLKVAGVVAFASSESARVRLLHAHKLFQPFYFRVWDVETIEV
ncbi:hypothetical protein M0R45_019335 [Rubus argutus]|uniref:Uncharacterized protein n=1 Tax=Rubus argutus TaxID=59490 RepID=A0AAW1X8S5_RUBAR